MTGTMTDQEWKYYIKVHLSRDGALPYDSKFRLVSVPDHGEKMTEVSHRISWTTSAIPSLYSPFWFLMKWFRGTTLYRSEITSFGLVRHGWTGVVKIEFTYRTWFYCDETSCWQEI